jgi:ribonuclease P protein component
VAYAIGRRVGGAVVRNRLRRRLRAIVAELAPELVPGAYLVGAAPEAASLSFGELKAIVSHALKAVGKGKR